MGRKGSWREQGGEERRRERGKAVNEGLGERKKEEKKYKLGGDERRELKEWTQPIKKAKK